MEFHVRRYSGFKELSVEDGATEFVTGFLDAGEAKRLAEKLREAADELSPIEDANG